MRFSLWKCFLGLLWIGCTPAQELTKPMVIDVVWTNLKPGVSWCETDAPLQSEVNDSKLTLIKLDPAYFEFELLVATALDRQARTAPDWADSFNLDIVINAGMYDLSRKLHSRGYLQAGKHKNNPKIHPTFNTMLALNPKDSTKQAMRMIDLKCEPWESVNKQYQDYAQGLRMLDCKGKAIGWNKRKQSCSMLATAMDEQGMIYLIYTRSPYTHNEFISFLQAMPFKLSHAIYLEGGPETSLYLSLDEHCIEKVGSYVSQTYPRDDNDHFWELPNVIGMRYKGK